MAHFAKGQRWISQAEPELGLGTLVALSHRRVTISFESSGCVREYTLDSAPLKRIVFRPGDTIALKDGTSQVITAISENGGLLNYHAGSRLIHESDLSDAVSFSLPEDRLLAGLHDSIRAFDRRHRIHEFNAAWNQSPARGFIGPQIDLIPHQFYIAAAVTSRRIPRVLLSDETGLGKTIEACLILHHLLVCDRITRVLIIVPESLVHQWFVELYRKFNITVRLFDNDHVRESLIRSTDGNPFTQDQMGIISLDFLKQNPQLGNMILEAGWDMVVADEIHHIDHHHDLFTFFTELSQNTTGMMLLSATPEQMGIENHFSHLRLLDPDRYHDYQAYLSQMDGYKALACTIERLRDENRPYEQLLDSYGPGRVVFKNTRRIIKGFPGRQARLYPLDGPPEKIRAVNLEFEQDHGTPFVNSGSPILFDFKDDPRIDKLIRLLDQYPADKFLVICSSVAKAQAVRQAVAEHINIRAAGFDETMTLIQRDRNAAWFAQENGARLLICSEIGSEGRNFQFSRHLFLFDLPCTPELLEQRIGRLDRIGQKNDIQIHVPFIRHTPYELLARWYMHGLNAFNTYVSGTHQIYIRFRSALEELTATLCRTGHLDETRTAAFLEDSARYCRELQARLRKGTNILLELNSFKGETASGLIREIRRWDRDRGLEHLVLSIFDLYEIPHEAVGHRTHMFSIHDSVDEGFPLPGPGGRPFTVTFDRKNAVALEHLDFYNADHPYVRKILDYVIQTGKGNCAFGCLESDDGPALLLETLFILESVSPKGLEVSRFMPALPIRVVMNHNRQDVTEQYPPGSLALRLQDDNPGWLGDMMELRQDMIPDIVRAAHTAAERQALRIKARKKKDAVKTLEREVQRLDALSRINPAIDKKEIDRVRQHLDALSRAMDNARLRLDSLRLIRIQP